MLIWYIARRYLTVPSMFVERVVAWCGSRQDANMQDQRSTHLWEYGG